MPRPYASLESQILHFLTVAWTITWITAVPLFHVHIPDTTDRWSALRSGGTHTVLTGDLQGEFSHPFHDGFGHLSQRAVNSPELGFVVFNNKPNDEKAKQVYICSASCQVPNAVLVSWPFECSGTYRGPPPSDAIPAFRAPPRSVCA